MNFFYCIYFLRNTLLPLNDSAKNIYMPKAQRNMTIFSYNIFMHEALLYLTLTHFRFVSVIRKVFTIWLAVCIV